MAATKADSSIDTPPREAPRPPDNAIRTSELDSEPAATESDTPAAAAPEGDAPEDSDSAPETPEKPQAPKRNRSAERRIARLTAKLAESEAKRTASESRLSELERSVEELRNSQPKPKPAPEPQLRDFDTPQEYAKAYAQWEEAKATPAAAKPPAAKPPATPEPKAPDPKDTEPDVVAPTDAELAVFFQEGAELGDAFAAAVKVEGLPVSKRMGRFMVESDVGPEMYVYLSKHPAEAAAIYRANKDDARTRLEKLEQTIRNAGDAISVEPEQPETPPEDSTPPPKGARRTKAPEPPSDATPRGGATRGVRPEDESMDEYAERRRKEEARRAGIFI